MNAVEIKPKLNRGNLVVVNNTCDIARLIGRRMIVINCGASGNLSDKEIMVDVYCEDDILDEYVFYLTELDLVCV